MSRRVVITGLGCVTPYGVGVDLFWNNLKELETCIDFIKRFDTSDYPVKTGAEIPDSVKFEDHIDPTYARRYDSCSLIGIMSAGEALTDAGFDAEKEDTLPVGVIMGSGIGSSRSTQEIYFGIERDGWKRVHPLGITKLMFNSLSSLISLYYKLMGVNYTSGAACASANISMGEAYFRVKSGAEDVVVTGGADLYIDTGIYGAWCNMRVLAKDPDPKKACRPFDKERSGLVASEGAGALIFEDYEHAKKRGAKIYGEVIGFGASSDATHITAPNPDGQAIAIEKAMNMAEINTGDVDYINAHGTSTQANDKAETNAIKKVFGDYSKQVPISSTKSILGHTMGASGSLEMIATLLSMKENIIIPTVNYDNPEPGLDLDYVPNKIREKDIKIALSNSFGFGGSNAVLVVKKI